MELITKSYLNSTRKLYESSQPYESLKRAVNLSKQRNSLSSEITIFLSHKHDEVKELENAIALLQSVKANVYVDWTDEGMPNTTSGETAKRLKDKIKSCKKFILVATEKAISSKWCNWELGLGDAHKYIQHIALLVVKDDNMQFSGSEYLKIYPVIGRRYSSIDGFYDVKFPDGSTVGLIQWLNS